MAFNKCLLVAIALLTATIIADAGHPCATSRERKRVYNFIQRVKSIEAKRKEWMIRYRHDEFKIPPSCDFGVTDLRNMVAHECDTSVGYIYERWGYEHIPIVYRPFDTCSVDAHLLTRKTLLGFTEGSIDSTWIFTDSAIETIVYQVIVNSKYSYFVDVCILSRELQTCRTKSAREK